MSYTKVSVYNSTNYTVKGKVYYASAFCSDDKYTAYAMNKWKASSRGVCLLTKVTATIYFEDGTTATATPYKSSGTSYSQFAVFKKGDGFSVTRIQS